MKRRLKCAIKQTLAHIGIDVRRLPPAPPAPVRWSSEAGAWTAGYGEAKLGLIERALKNPDLLHAFKVGQLPEGFGVAIDERCVEYPWMFSRLERQESTQVLDAGSVLNHEAIVASTFFQKNRVHILTLAPEKSCFWYKGISYLYADLRSIPIRDAFYDTIVCISTIEHIGCDNSRYTGDKSHAMQSPSDYLLAIGELRRVLKAGGQLYLTVPFGKLREFKSFRQFDQKLLASVIDGFGPADVTKEFFKYTQDGWNKATESECVTCDYVPWVASIWDGGQWPDPVPIEDDRAAAARAVACLTLTKR